MTRDQAIAAFDAAVRSQLGFEIDNPDALRATRDDFVRELERANEREALTLSNDEARAVAEELHHRWVYLLRRCDEGAPQHDRAALVHRVSDDLRRLAAASEARGER